MSSTQTRSVLDPDLKQPRSIFNLVYYTVQLTFNNVSQDDDPKYDQKHHTYMTPAIGFSNVTNKHLYDFYTAVRQSVYDSVHL